MSDEAGNVLNRLNVMVNICASYCNVTALWILQSCVCASLRISRDDLPSAVLNCLSL
jgi:hypothetical protein